MKNIEVTYDGSYPTLCMGTLTIKVEGDLYYKDKFCCSSLGSVWFDDDGCEHVEEGAIVWDDRINHPKEIQDAVKECLLGYMGCCGGCI